MGNRVLAALALGGATVTAACQFVTEVDRSKIPGAGDGSSVSTTSSGPGGGGGHGGSGAAGGGGQGGGGANQGGGGEGQGGGAGGGGNPACADQKKDGSETDVDCGGGMCPPCATGHMCSQGTDCASGKCVIGTCVDVLFISEVRSRGVGGQNDEFVELYNPTSAAVTVSSLWHIDARSAVGNCQTVHYAQLWTGAGQVIPSHGHLLIANGGMGGYTQKPAPDVTYPGGAAEIADAASLRLMHGSSLVDAVCFFYNDTTRTSLLTCAEGYTCEGTPATNPHNGTGATNVDASLERKPGGAGGNGIDTGNNSADLATHMPARPEALASPPVP